jgi:carboxymethylenebutenolidase
VLRETISRMARDVEIGLPGGRHLEGAVTRPEPEGPHPGVVVVHEAFGDQPEIRAVCDRFAERGYVAVMPDLFSDGVRAICMARAMAEVRSGKPGRVNGYLEAARAWLGEQDEVDEERIGMIGFCMGGGFALAYVGSGSPGVRAASVNYGEVPKDATSLGGACPIVGSYGGRDRVVGRRQGERLAAHLEALGIEHDVKVYEDAGHSFMTQGHHPIGRLIALPMRLGYAPDAADDAWRRVFAFFDARLKAA